MFRFNNNEVPSRKTVYVKKDGQLELEYIITKTREILNAYEDGSCIASIFVTRQRFDEVTGYTVQVFGEYQQFEYIIGMKNGKYLNDFVLPEDLFGFEEELNSKRRANKIKGATYTPLEQEMDLNLDKYNSIEEFLYENTTLDEIVDEQGIDLSWTEDKDYRILTSREDIESFIEGLAETENLVGFDTETTGLLVGCVKKDILVGMSMSYEDDCGYYFPLEHKRFDNIEIPKDEFLDMLRPYIDTNGEHAKDLVAHNGGFDWKVMKQHDFDLNIVHDTFLRHGLLDIQNAKFDGALKNAVSKLLGIDVIELTDMYKNKSRKEISAVKKAVFEYGVPIDEITKYKLERIDFFKGRDATLPYDFRYASRDFVEVYGSADADFPRIIFNDQKDKWNNSLNTVYRIEMETMKTLGEQEYWGIPTDASALEELNEKAKEKLKNIEEKIYAIAGETFNISSSQQLAYILFDKLKCEYSPRFNTKSGGRGTSKNVLKSLSRHRDNDGNIKYPITELLLERSEVNQLINNFYGNLPKLIHEGRLFTSYNQLGTETGRVSARKPNIQQMESTVRYHMHVEDPEEYYYMICDYSQVEYRVMGGLSGEPKVVDFFKTNPEADYHIQAYANMHNIPYETVTGKQRDEGKILNFGTTYGLEDDNLAINLFGRTSELHRQLARDARTKYFEGIPVLDSYFESVRDKAEETGYVTTLFGRLRWIPEFRGKNVAELSDYERASGRRKAGNTPVQGTAADIQKFAMYRIRKVFNRENISEQDAHLVLNVHDEIAVQIHKKYNPYYILSLMREAMEMDLSKYGLPPLYIGAIIGTNWGAGQNDDMEMPVILMDEIVERVNNEGIKYNEDSSVENLLENWQEEINKFAIRQIAYEIENRNVQSEDECHDVGRIHKYSGYFSNPDAIIKLVFESELNEERLNEIQNDYLEFLEPLSDYKFVPSNMEDENVELTPLGQPLPEDNDTIRERIKEHLAVSRMYEHDTEDTIHIRLAYTDEDFLEVIESLLVERDAFVSGLFKDSQKYMKVQIYLGTDTPYVIKHRGIISGMVKLLAYYMSVHLFGIGTYERYKEKIDNTGTKLLNPKQLA